MIEYRHRPIPTDTLQQEIAEAFGDDLPRLLQLYPGIDRRDRAAESDFMGDHFFGARTYWYARHHAGAGHPTWLYLFARTPPNPRQTSGAYHGAELPFVHGSSVPILPLTAEDKVLATEMQKYWISFAAGADPNGSAAVPWPQFHSNDAQWLVLDHVVRAEAVSRAEKYEILNARTARLVDAMAAIRAG